MEISLSICGRRIKLVKDGGCVAVVESAMMEERVDRRWNGMLEFVERLVVAHAAEDIDVTAPAYTKGIETVLESVANEY